MTRIHGQRFAEVIAAGIDRVPVTVMDCLPGLHFVAGVDPVFIGLHRYEGVKDGRSYRDTAHCCYGEHLFMRPRSDRPTTIVLPTLPSVRTVVHEIGHAFDEALGFSHAAAPVTRYAETDRQEAFAEAFASWLVPDDTPWAKDYFDPATRHLMEALA